MGVKSAATVRKTHISMDKLSACLHLLVLIGKFHHISKINVRFQSYIDDILCEILCP